MTAGRREFGSHGDRLMWAVNEVMVRSSVCPRSGGSPRNLPGLSLVELLVVLTLTGVLGSIIMTTLVGSQRYARQHSARVAAAEASRVAAALLAAELRYLDPATDIYGHGPDSVALRAFRGVAVACASAAGTVLVRYRGLRAPDPVKDSVIVTGISPAHEGAGAPPGPGIGGASASSLAASSEISSGCELQAGESLYRWTLNPLPSPGALLLLFESGSYHLNGGALRYRRGDAGRQPLTAELLDDRAVSLEWAVGGGEGSGAGSDSGTTGGGSLAGVAIVLATKPAGDGSAAVSRRARHWIRLRNGDRW